MPRRNNRKRYRHEGELGFNPDKYISGSGHYHHTPQRPIVCTERTSRPAANRHKARNKTAKYRRAWNDISQMQQTADRVKMPQSLPLEMRTPVKLEQKQPTAGAAVATDTQKTITTIIGGIKKWIRTILHA